MTLPISIIIPTYQREQVLIDTLAHLLSLPVPAAEIIVVDQTPEHEPEITVQLQQWHAEGCIRWLTLAQPSIPKAMNQGLLAARYDWVLYLDDDIIPEPELVAAHWQAHQDYAGIIVAGRVIQPWEEAQTLTQPLPSSSTFAAHTRAWLDQFMGGNFSIRRGQLIDLGGLDENFVRVAYQFEAECAHRFRLAGGQILFEPKACIHHLKVSAGGTRSHGHHLTTWRPHHSVGAYYYLLRARGLPNRGWRILHRPLRSIATRHHLRHPWWILPTLVSEFWGLLWAGRLAWQGPRYVSADVNHS